MKKNIRWYLLMVLSLWIIACNNVHEDTEPVEIETPPGQKYNAQGKYNLNVIYFIPADMDTLPRWHKRLSEVTLYVQEFYRQNMKKRGFQKTFNLELNEANPKYIKIRCIRSTKDTLALKNIGDIVTDVKTYFKNNPEELASNHFLIYTPKYSTSYYGSGITESVDSSGVYDYGINVLRADQENFDMYFFNSDRARKRFLPYLGYLVQGMGRSFFLSGCALRTSDTFYPLMSNTYIQRFIGTLGSNGIVGTPDNFGITDADALILSELQVFNDIDRTYYQERAHVTVDSIHLSYDHDTIRFSCDFRTPDEVAGVIVYHDPWRSVTGNQRNEDLDKKADSQTSADAISYVITRNITKSGDTYKASIDIPWTDLPTSMQTPYYGQPFNTMAYEFRVRFVMKYGTFVPYLGDPNFKGEPSFRRSYRSATITSPTYPNFNVPNEIK